MVTTLYLVRHGSADAGGVRRYHGSVDVPLLEEGVEQMKGACGLIIQYLGKPASARSQAYSKDVNDREETNPEVGSGEAKSHGLTAVYCSDLQRAVRSAEIIAGPHGLNPIRMPALRERNFGIWEGMTFNEIQENYPREFDAWLGNPLHYNPVGGESTLDVRLRVIRATENIVGSHPGENIAVIAHGGVNRIILCEIMGMPLENMFRIEQDYGAVNIIEFWGTHPVVELLNGRDCVRSSSSKEPKGL